MKKICLGNNSYINVRLIDFSALNYLCIYLPFGINGFISVFFPICIKKQNAVTVCVKLLILHILQCHYCSVDAEAIYHAALLWAKI